MTRAQLEKLRIATAEPHKIVGARRFVEVEVDDLKAALAVIDKAVAGARAEGDAPSVEPWSPGKGVQP